MIGRLLVALVLLAACPRNEIASTRGVAAAPKASARIVESPRDPECHDDDMNDLCLSRDEGVRHAWLELLHTRFPGHAFRFVDEVDEVLGPVTRPRELLRVVAGSPRAGELEMVGRRARQRGWLVGR